MKLWQFIGGRSREQDTRAPEVRGGAGASTVKVMPLDVLTDTRAHVPWVAQGATFRARQSETVTGIGRQTRTVDQRQALTDALGEILASKPAMSFAQAFSGKIDSFKAEGFAPPEPVLQAFGARSAGIDQKVALFSVELDGRPAFVLASTLSLQPGVRVELFDGAGEKLDEAVLRGERGSGVIDVSWGAAAETSAPPAIPSAPAAPAKGWLEQLADAPGHVLALTPGGLRVVDPLPGGRPQQGWWLSPGPLPERDGLEQLQGRDRATALVLGTRRTWPIGQTRLGVILPPGFDPERQPPYTVRLALVRGPGELAAALSGAARAEEMDRGSVTVLVDTLQPLQGNAAAQKLLLRDAVWQELREGERARQLNVALEPPALVPLSSSPEELVRALASPAIADDTFEAERARWKFVFDTRSSVEASLREIRRRSSDAGLDVVVQLERELATVPGSEALGQLPALEQRIGELRQRVDGLLGVIRGQPRFGLPLQIEAALALVAAQRPEFSDAIRAMVECEHPYLRAPDPATGRTLAEALVDLLRSNGATHNVYPQVLAAFFEGLRKGEIPWQPQPQLFDGAIRQAVLDHPTLPLVLAAGAAQGRELAVAEAYRGDGRRSVPPAWSTTPFRDPGALSRVMGAVVAQLRPTNAHPDLVHGELGLVAVALSKLTGEPMRYGYAFNLKDGAGLGEMLDLQGGALAFGQVAVEIGGVPRSLMFPVFSREDEDSVRVSSMHAAPFVVRLDELTFPESAQARPAVLHRLHAGFEPFLTPELERRWRDVYPSLAQSYPAPLPGYPPRPQDAVTKQTAQDATGTEPRPGAQLGASAPSGGDAKAQQSSAPAWRSSSAGEDRRETRGGSSDAQLRAQASAPPAPVELALPDGLPAAAAAALRTAAQALPELNAALNALTRARPELFTGVDPVTKKGFAEQIQAFVADGHAARDAAGFARFLERVAKKEFLGNVPGYSHTHGVGRAIVLAHPGLILELIRAAQDGRPYPTHGGYPGDGRREVPPSRAFREPFERDWSGMMAYELGFLQLAVDVLAPADREIHPDLVQGRSPLAAIGFQKLTGLPFRYGYAFKIQNGADLVEALKSQPYGLAMGDVFIPGVGFQHFCHFSDFDPESRTVLMASFGDRLGRRLPVDELRFSEVGTYYLPAEAFDAFRTPDRERRYGQRHEILRQLHREPLA